MAYSFCLSSILIFLLLLFLAHFNDGLCLTQSISERMHTYSSWLAIKFKHYACTAMIQMNTVFLIWLIAANITIINTNYLRCSLYCKVNLAALTETRITIFIHSTNCQQ